jgi:diphthamide synthase (EF-2-diphthine--ammonia ligase)
MHAVRRELVDRQAEAAGLPLWRVPIPSPCPNEIYEARMREAVDRARAEGFTHVAFGDLFLEDVRRYREERLAGTGLDPLFPLWGRPTDALARDMLAAGLEATITCVDPRQLDATFVGRRWDTALLDALPATVDPCGERGEFHTFCHAGPMFARPIPVSAGVTVEREGFVFADVVWGSGVPEFRGSGVR